MFRQKRHNPVYVNNIILKKIGKKQTIKGWTESENDKMTRYACTGAAARNEINNMVMKSRIHADRHKTDTRILTCLLYTKTFMSSLL